MPMMTASTGASFRLGASRAELPWQNSTNSPMPAPTLSTATIVLDPGRNLVGSLSSTNWGRTRSSLRPLIDGSFFVATTEPSTRARNMCVKGLKFGDVPLAGREAFLQRQPFASLLFGGRFFRQHGFHILVGPGNNVDTDEVALNGLDGLGAGIRGRFDRGDVADNDRGDQGVADLGHRAGQLHVGGFKHGVGAFYEGD